MKYTEVTKLKVLPYKSIKDRKALSEEDLS